MATKKFKPIATEGRDKSSIRGAEINRLFKLVMSPEDYKHSKHEYFTLTLQEFKRMLKLFNDYANKYK